MSITVVIPDGVVAKAKATLDMTDEELHGYIFDFICTVLINERLGMLPFGLYLDRVKSGLVRVPPDGKRKKELE